MDMDKIAQERIEELEQEIQDCHVIIDLLREDLADLRTENKVLRASLKHARSAMKVEVA